MATAWGMYLIVFAGLTASGTLAPRGAVLALVALPLSGALNMVGLV